MKKVYLLAPIMLLSTLVGCGNKGGNSSDCLCFTSHHSTSSSIKYVITYLVPETEATLDINIQSSKDGNSWQDWTFSLAEGSMFGFSESISLNPSEKLYVRNTKNTLTNKTAIFTFQIDGGLMTASGNVMSMINFGGLSDYCFASMFFNCDKLILPPRLPATTLSNYCYAGMFYRCKYLITSPVLPATTLSAGCYAGMFYGCTSLEVAPDLPATTLSNYCYEDMFNGCANLIFAPELPATTLCESCYREMFLGCSSLKFIPELPATELVKSCYSLMFAFCESLLIGENEGEILIFKCPETLPEYCVTQMFYKTGGTFMDETPKAGNSYFWIWKIED